MGTSKPTTYDELKTRILSGRFRPGTAMVEREVAEEQGNRIKITL